MGFDDGRIVLNSENGAYFAGQTVEAKLVFNQDKVKTFRGIYAKIKGFCQVHWTTHHTRRVSDGRGGHRSESYTETHESHEVYVERKVYLVGGETGEHKLQPGSHEFPFSFPLPANCPSSFEGAHGHIRYEVKVVVDRAYKFDQEKKIRLTVIAPMDLNTDPYCNTWRPPDTSSPVPGASIRPHNRLIDAEIMNLPSIPGPSPSKQSRKHPMDADIVNLPLYTSTPVPSPSKRSRKRLIDADIVNPPLNTSTPVSSRSKRSRKRPIDADIVNVSLNTSTPVPSPSKRLRKRPIDVDIENLSYDSGSDDDDDSDDDNEERNEDWADPGITMRQAARRLRELEIEREHSMLLGSEDFVAAEIEIDSTGEDEYAVLHGIGGGNEDMTAADIDIASPRVDRFAVMQEIGDGNAYVVPAHIEITSPGVDGCAVMHGIGDGNAYVVPADIEVILAEGDGDVALGPPCVTTTLPIGDRELALLDPSVGNGNETGVPNGAGLDRELCNDPKSYTFSWSDNFDTFSGKEEVYRREPGPNIASIDPMEIFNTIWDVSLMGRIVDQTNLYAWQTIAALSESDSIPKYLDTWVETTIEEMRRLFAVLMLMSLDYRPRVDDYWTKGILHMPAFRELMSRNRFQLLMKFLHFTNNFDIPRDMRSYEKKIAKIRYLFEYVQNKFSTLYTPSRALSLDETLLLWKGRLSWVQCIRSKAARFGIKSFELCESSTGYLLKSMLYAGKESSFVEGAIHGFSNKTSKIVLELMDGYLDVGHLVVMDNWYNQLPLTRYLKRRKTDVLGTLNRNGVFVPAAIKSLDPRRMTRGQQVARHCGDIAVTAWRDVKLVTTISTYHNDEQVAGRRSGQPILRPAAIGTYNKNMGGVDLKDTKLSSYPMERKRGRKWYLKVFARLLNTSILNSYIIYSKNSMGKGLEHRQFRYTLVQSLLESSHQVQVPRCMPADSSQCRLDRRHDHYPIHTEATTGKRDKYRRRRCKRCTAQGSRSEVSLMCSKCLAPLCIGKCWIDYHTLDEL